MQKSIKKNYFYNLLYQIFAMIIPLITVPYISRVLGADGIGIYGFTTSITTYFILIGTIGIATYGQREIAYVQDDKKKRSKIFFELCTIRAIAITLSVIVYFFLFCLGGKYAIYYRILLFEILAYIFDMSFFFQGLEDFKKVALRNIFVKTILLIATFVFVKTSNDVWIFILIYMLSILLGNLSLCLSLKKYLCKPGKLNLVRHIKPIFLLFIPQIAIQVYTVLDKTMLGWLLDDISNVGYYEQAQKLVKLSLAVITTFGTVMMPRIASINSAGNEKELFENIKKSFRFVWFLGLPIAFGLLAVSDRFVPIFYGSGYDEVAILIKLFTPLVLIIGFANVVGVQYLISTKKQNYYTIAVVCSAIINVVLNFILIPTYKTVGASISSVVAELLGLAIQLYFVRKIFKVFPIVKMINKYLISALIMFGVCFAINQIPAKSIYILMIEILFGTTSYFLSLILLKEEFIVNLLKSINRRLSKE